MLKRLTFVFTMVVLTLPWLGLGLFAAEAAQAKGSSPFFIAYESNNELTLFDSSGEATAYISTSTDLTIYLWDGSPVAYLVDRGGGFHIYGFNGDHLGWFEDGIVWDHQGRAVGGIKDALDMVTMVPSIKGLKSIKPIKSVKSVPPVKPYFTNTWSRSTLRQFLSAGED